MSIKELNARISTLIDDCDSTPQQQFIKGVLLSLRATMEISRERALYDHVLVFARQELVNIDRMRKQQQSSLN